MGAALHRAANAVAALSLGAVFAIFIAGIFMRYGLGRPLSWSDEAVTLLAAWSVFWTAATVLRWPDFITFDVVFGVMPPCVQRAMLLLGSAGLAALLGAALPGTVDYTLFLWRERTDAMEIRLDIAYAIFPAFLAAMVLRLAITAVRLVLPGWRDELARWQPQGEQHG